MKKYLALFLALIMLAAMVAGCAKKPAATPTTDDSAATKPDATVDTTDPEADAPVYTQTYEWNVSSTFGGPAMRNIEAMLEEVTERTNGRMKFTYYWSNALVSIPEVPDALRDGIADIAIVASVNYPSIFTYNAEIVGMPFSGVQDGYQAIEAWYALTEEFPDEMQGEWDTVGAFPWFCYATAGYSMFFIDGKTEVRTPADLAGHKIMSGKPQMLDLVNANGGAAIQAAPTVYYENLEKGVCDGVINAYSVVRTFGALELLKAGTEFGDAGAFYDMFFIAISQKSWDTLDPEVQQAFLDVNAEKRADMLEMTRTLEDNSNAIKERSPDFKLSKLTDEEVKLWEEAMVPINEKALEHMMSTYKRDKCQEMYEYMLKWLAEKNG